MNAFILFMEAWLASLLALANNKEPTNLLKTKSLFSH